MENDSHSRVFTEQYKAEIRAIRSQRLELQTQYSESMHTILPLRHHGVSMPDLVNNDRIRRSCEESQSRVFEAKPLWFRNIW